MPGKKIYALSSLLILSGCAPVDVGFGEAVRWDVAQQVIDPDPGYDSEIIEGGSGEHANRAVDRYNRDQVKQPVSIGTSSITSSSSSSSSSSSGPR